MIAIVCGLTWIAIAGEQFLPSLLSRDAVQYDRGAVRLAALFQEALCIGALLLLWFRRNCVLDLWLMVLSFTLVLDVTMSSLLAAARFDVGWYASRIFALTASIVVLIVLLSETTALYANLARSVLRQRGVRAGAADCNGCIGRFDRPRDQPAAGGDGAECRCRAALPCAHAARC